MKLQLRIAKPVAEFPDLRAILIIQVLPRAENFDQRDAGVPDAIQPNGRQPMIDEQVRRKRPYHQYPATLPDPRPSVPPCSQPPSITIASTRAIETRAD